MSGDPLVSVVIPVKNGIHTIESCLRAISLQTLIGKTEIIVIDSGSTDGSLEFLKKHGNIRLIEIPPTSFSHGSTRNLGVSEARGKFVVMTVQDAIAADDRWLERMTKHFEDLTVAGVCGQQVVPHDRDKNPHQWFRPVSAPSVKRISFSSPEEFEKLSPPRKKKVCLWDNVNAAYRKEVLLQVPFRGAFFAEDAMWARDALSAGHVLVYDDSAKVHHYHFQSPEYTYKRTLTQLYFDHKIFHHDRQNPKSGLEYLKVVYRNFRYGAHPKWIGHNLRMLSARDRAFRDFYKRLAGGDSELDAFYKSTCEVPPQGLVKKEL